MDQLLHKQCVPCEGGIAPLTKPEITPLMGQVPGWTLLDDDTKISRDFDFKNFKEALKCINDIGAIAEAEGHHPNLYLHEYKHVRVTNYTHAIGGLHENDFILAAKINQLLDKA